MENDQKWSTVNIGEEIQPTRPFLYIASNYLWLIFYLFIYLYYQFSTQYQEVSTIKSLNQSHIWNSTYNPHIFGFISDAHVTSFFPEDINITTTLLQTLNETGVEKILIGGDIGDNFATKSSVKHGHQYEDDYIIYKRIADEYPRDFLIVASGNHDEFGVEKYDSSEHYILQYCDFYKKDDKYKNYDNFLISKIDHEDIEIFVMNPYHYPTVRAGLGYHANLTGEMLDKIEYALSAPSNSKSRFLLTHFPLSYTNNWAKSSSKKSLIDIATSSNLSAILVGHSHHELILHRKSSLEIRPRSIKKGKSSGFGLRYISVDNGGVSDSGFVLNEIERPVAVLTYPVKKKYVSDQTDFSFDMFNKGEIRVVHFSENKNLNISVSCRSSSNKFSDIKTSRLKFQRIIRSNQSLYSTSLKQVCYRENDDKFNEVEYHLTFLGDWNYEADFVAGESVKLEKEILDFDEDMRKFVCVIGLICWIVILYVWCPIPPFKYFDKIAAMFAGQKHPSLINYELGLSDGIIGAIFGFFLIKSRIYYNIPKWLQYTYLIMILSPLFVPISLMKIGKHSYGFIYFIGYYLNGFAFDIWGFQLTSYFVLFVLLPSTVVFSAASFLRQTKKWNYFFIVDIALFLAQFVLIYIAIFTALYQSTSLVFALTSPIFAIIPIIIISSEIIIIVKFVISLINNNDKKHFLYDDYMYY